MHFSLNAGVALNVFFYAMEFFARTMCYREENLVNTFIPRSYECYITGSYQHFNNTMS